MGPRSRGLRDLAASLRIKKEECMKNAYLFSGQGAQIVDMGKDLAEQYPSVQAFYDQAADILGYQPLDLTETQLADTLYAQPATVCLSLAIWQALPPATDEYVLGGFSLGEYAAFAAAGVFDTESLLHLVAERARLMSIASQTASGKMYAVLGLEDQVIETVLAQTDYAGRVWPVNYNCPGQLVIAGSSEAADAAAAELKASGAKRVLALQVSGAFHTPLMQPAAEALSRFAAELTIQPPSCPLYSNGTALPLSASAAANFPGYLAQHMTGPVLWTQTITNMYNAGVRRFVELGPGKTLRGLVQKILKGHDDVEILNIGTAADLTDFLMRT